MRTAQVYGTVCVLNRNPSMYIGLIDGPGEYYSSQFQVVTPADVLLILLDHNSQENEIAIDENHIQDQKNFQIQLRNYLTQQTKRPNSVRLLLNKRDLWEQNEPNKRSQLNEFLKTEEKAWIDSNLITDVSSTKHSNKVKNLMIL